MSPRTRRQSAVPSASRTAIAVTKIERGSNSFRGSAGAGFLLYVQLGGPFSTIHPIEPLAEAVSSMPDQGSSRRAYFATPASAVPPIAAEGDANPDTQATIITRAPALAQYPLAGM